VTCTEEKENTTRLRKKFVRRDPHPHPTLTLITRRTNFFLNLIKLEKQDTMIIKFINEKNLRICELIDETTKKKD
jgi:hypothetical protein